VLGLAFGFMDAGSIPVAMADLIAAGDKLWTVVLAAEVPLFVIRALLLVVDPSHPAWCPAPGSVAAIQISSYFPRRNGLQM
jgi:hypothetical protein